MDNNTPNADEGVQVHRVRKPLNKYVRIGILAFSVIALSIWFYYTFFEQHSLFGFIKSVGKSLRPFVIGAVLAYLLKPICAFFEKLLNKAFAGMKNRNLARNLALNTAIGITSVLFVTVLYVMLAAVLPQVADSVRTISGNVPGWIDSATEWLENVTANLPAIQSQIKEFSENFSDKITELINKFIVSNDNASDIFFNVTNGVKETLVLLKDIFIGAVSCIYILHERKKFASQGKMIVYSIFKEKWADKIMEEARFTDKMFGGYINGTIIDSFIIGLLCFLFCSICRIPYTVLVSVIVGVTNVIPFFGPFIGGIPAAMIVLMVNPLKGLYFIIIVIAIQQFDGNILKPKILGNSTGVSSFWVLFSITVFGGIWGFAGMVLGVPLFAVLYDLIRQLIVKGLKKHDRQDMYDDYREEQDIRSQAKAEAKARRVAGLTKMNKFKINKNNK